MDLTNIWPDVQVGEDLGGPIYASQLVAEVERLESALRKAYHLWPNADDMVADVAEAIGLPRVAMPPSFHGAQLSPEGVAEIRRLVEEAHTGQGVEK